MSLSASPTLHLHTTVMPVADETSSKRVRIVDAALRCVAAKGIRTTTVDDVARAAGMSRATLYRALPGGRDAIFQAIVDTELARFFSSVAVAMGSALDLEDVVVAGITTSASWISGSEALATVLDDEPWVVLRHLSFGEMDHALGVAADFTGPFFGRFLEPEEAARTAEWTTRIVVSYLLDPDPLLDLEDEASVRGFVRRHVLPGIAALCGADG